MRVTRREYEIGIQSEEVVSIALRELKNEKKIRDFLKKDIPGSDFFILSNEDRQIRLQVKTSQMGAIYHRMRYGEKIPALVIRHHSRKLHSSARKRLVRKAKTEILDLLSPDAMTAECNFVHGQS